MLPVVGREGLVDESRPAGGELGPGDVDPVLEGGAAGTGRRDRRPARAGAGVVVDSHELLVLEREEGCLTTGFEDRPAWEVVRRAVILRRAEDEEAARPIGIACRGRSALEQLAGEIRVALAIPSEGRVTARLPVLARECVPSADRVAGEVVRRRGVVPGPTLIEAV